MITVKMSKEHALDMLLDRCKTWEVTKDNIDLFEKMYESALDSGCFDGAEYDVMSIVDNDVVNYCDVIYADDENTKADFKKLLELYKAGERDVSCEDFENINPSYIEAVSDDEQRILIRW